MSRYLETAESLGERVRAFLDLINRVTVPIPTNKEPEVAVALGHLINLAVRCNPRQAQGTVRKNIVAVAMRGLCKVTMTKETDEKTGRTYNKIHIHPKN